MKNYLRNLMFVFVFLGILAAVILLKAKFIGYNGSMNKSETVADVKIIDALASFERKSVDEGENDQNRGTIYLTGDFEKYSSFAIDRMVKTTLKDINYEKIVEMTDKDASIIVVINKQKPHRTHDLMDYADSADQQRSNSMVNAQNFSLEVIKKLGLCEKCTSKMPLMIRHFENTKKGIKSMVISIAKQLPRDDKSEDLQPKISCSPEMLATEHSNLSEFIPQRLSKIGPKIFLEISKK